MKVKGTLGSVEQNNYAVGEQRERDTKGWSDSEANKLRSFPPTHPFSFEGEGKEGMQSGEVNGRVPFWDLVV